MRPLLRTGWGHNSRAPSAEINAQVVRFRAFGYDSVVTVETTPKIAFRTHIASYVSIIILCVALGLSWLSLHELALPNVIAAQETGMSDFEARCHAAGVVKCVGFDSEDEIGPFVSKDSNGIVRAALDNNIKASGQGSLRFEIPSHSGQNSSGAWTSSLGASFGQGQAFYVQYRQRFSTDLLKSKYAGGAGWKQSIFHMAGKTCGSVELTTVNAYYRGFPVMYTDCGSRDFTVNLGNSDFLLEHGDSSATSYNCHYQHPTPADCAFYKPNQWMTFYYEVKIGNWGKPNSSVRAWVGYEGRTLKQFVNGVNYQINFNSGSGDVFDSVSLLPYNTGKSGSEENRIAYTWYDELIVSKSPISPPHITGK